MAGDDPALATVGGNSIRRLIRDVGRIPDDLRRRLRPRIRQVAQPILGHARTRASWSTRIPASLRIFTSFTRRRAGASIVASRRVAPHARAYEGIRGNRTFRRPVYGNRNAWVEQRTRPFLGPAVDIYGRDVARGVNEVVDEAAEAAGFRRSTP